jgi:hypothetical protein
MKYLFFLSFFIISIFDAMAQSPNNFSLGFADSVRSDILKEQRHLLIYTPYQGKKSRAATDDHYPVIYVLDGENNFRSVAITVERLANMDLCPPMIVVGIPNTDRSRDLTPTTVANNTDGVKNSGGGERFLAFIEKELIPHIDSNYLTAPYKLFMAILYDKPYSYFELKLTPTALGQYVGNYDISANYQVKVTRTDDQLILTAKQPTSCSDICIPKGHFFPKG